MPNRMGRRAFLRHALLGLGVTATALGGCSKPQAVSKGTIEDVKPREAVPVPPVRFKDITDQAGIRFVHTNGSFGKKLLPETMGGGVAFLDYDGDGRQDILFVNSCYWPGFEDKMKAPPTLALYRNRGGGTFEDVTAASGLAVTMYGMGVTVGDYDNDGWPDIFVTGVGGNKLFKNVEDGQGGRKFVDVTEKAGVGGPGGWPVGPIDFLRSAAELNWSSSAAFFDYDGDGLLDLFVCNYVGWSPLADLSQKFTLPVAGEERAFGPPTNFTGTYCFLYRNKGKGVFQDVTRAAGIPVYNPLARPAESFQAALPFAGPLAVVDTDLFAKPVGKSLGVLATDLDDDGWPDLLVANDTARNFLFRNVPDGKGGRKFVEMAVESTIAYSEGQVRGAMGIDRGEYRPGHSAVLITNFADEPPTFARLDNPKQMLFSDVAVAEGLSGQSRSPLKFGCFFFDYDLDGRLDLLLCNGHLEPEIGKVQKGQSYPQPVQLYWNTGGKRADGKTTLCFELVPPEAAGTDLFKPLVGRGCAYADIDGDGYLDVVLVENGGKARLLKNEGGTGNHWVRLVLQGDGKTSNTSAIGAKVTLEAGGLVQRREVLSARGYLSQSELPVTFGLGKTDKIDRVTVQWPGKGAWAEEWTDVAVDKVRTLKQGTGKRK